jgi:hypothetical protein
MTHALLCTLHLVFVGMMFAGYIWLAFIPSDAPNKSTQQIWAGCLAGVGSLAFIATSWRLCHSRGHFSVSPYSTGLSPTTLPRTLQT